MVAIYPQKQAIYGAFSMCSKKSKGQDRGQKTFNSFARNPGMARNTRRRHAANPASLIKNNMKEKGYNNENN
jgi:hypothetical protein